MSIRAAAIWTMSGQYLGFAIQFVATVVISRYFLTPEEVGVFSLALSAAMLVSILQDFGITRYVAGAQHLGPEQIRTCFSVSVLFALTIGLVILALAWPAARFYDDARLLPLLVIIAGSYLLVPFGIVPCALMQRDMHFGFLAIVNLLAVLTNSIVAIALAALDFSAFALAWGAVAQQGMRALAAWILCQHSLSIRLSTKGAGPILRFGSSVSFLYVSGSIGTRAPELIIGHMLGMTAVGLFGRAMGLSDQLRMLVSGSVGGVFYSAFARIRDRGEPLAGPYLRVVAAYSAVTWPAMALLAAASTPLVILLYGSIWADVGPLLLWISIGQIAFAALPLHMEIPIVMGKIGRLLRLNILDSIASIVFLTLCALVSLEAAALSRVAYGIVWIAIYAKLMQDLTGFQWKPLLTIYLRSAAVTIASIIPLIMIYFFVIPPGDMDFVLLFVSVLTGGLAWIAALFAVEHPMRQDVIAIILAVCVPLRKYIQRSRTP